MLNPRSRSRQTFFICLLVSLLVPLPCLAQTTQRTIPAPLPDHPGNIFLATEPVKITLPEKSDVQWKLLNYEQNEVKRVTSKDGVVDLAHLDVGYYELHAPKWPRITIGVLDPLAAPTPEDSPISIDVAMAWFFKTEPEQRAVANLCRLAGINWVRDRLNWAEIEPAPGRLAAHTIYDDTARVQSEAGLKILQVNHIPPPASKDRNRFPEDLRDVYRFYQEIAPRWKGKVLAIEPWNEADISVFGGHTGSEMATLQKAAYLGIKAANPDMIACENVFAVSRQTTLKDFGANHAPFDTYDLHHYVSFDKYPQFYANHRAVSDGKPLWVTECNTPVQFSDEKTKEPTDADLRVQAKCVGKIYSLAIYQGAKNVFYFMLPNYTERKIQYGVLHADLAPRPAYLAVAAAGRILAGAKPLGKWQTDDANISAYLFQSRPNGKERFVLVAWRDGGDKDITLNVPTESVYDHLGRQIKPRDIGKLALTDGPTYAVMESDPRKTLKFEPPPASPPVVDQPALPLVLQLRAPKEMIDLKQSSYRIPADAETKLPIVAYNFSDQPIHAQLKAEFPEGWDVQIAPNIAVQPGEIQQLDLIINPRGNWSKNRERITLRAGDTVLSFRVIK